jgi:hypothetical protein
MILHPVQDTRISPAPAQTPVCKGTVVSMARFRLERNIRRLTSKITEIDHRIARTEKSVAAVGAFLAALTAVRQA